MNRDDCDKMTGMDMTRTKAPIPLRTLTCTMKAQILE